MLTLESYEELHCHHPWLVWLPSGQRRVFAAALEAAASDDERERLAGWWGSAVERALASDAPADPVMPVQPAA